MKTRSEYSASYFKRNTFYLCIFAFVSFVQQIDSCHSRISELQVQLEKTRDLLEETAIKVLFVLVILPRTITIFVVSNSLCEKHFHKY